MAIIADAMVWCSGKKLLHEPIAPHDLAEQLRATGPDRGGLNGRDSEVDLDPPRISAR